jgi:hypothetical protein
VLAGLVGERKQLASQVIHSAQDNLRGPHGLGKAGLPKVRHQGTPLLQLCTQRLLRRLQLRVLCCDFFQAPTPSLGGLQLLRQNARLAVRAVRLSAPLCMDCQWRRLPR